MCLTTLSFEFQIHYNKTLVIASQIVARKSSWKDHCGLLTAIYRPYRPITTKVMRTFQCGVNPKLGVFAAKRAAADDLFVSIAVSFVLHHRRVHYAFRY